MARASDDVDVVVIDVYRGHGSPNPRLAALLGSLADDAPPGANESGVGGGPNLHAVSIS